MNYLAINTSGRFEILLVAGAREFYFSSEEKRLASAELFPTIQKLLSEARLAPSDIDMFGCVVGPGSFTGIRIGVSAVRALCYALKKPAVSVTAFDVLAYNNTAMPTEPFATVIDGGGDVCYIKNYGCGDEEPRCIRRAELPIYACGRIIEEAGSGGLKNAFEAAIKGGKAGNYSQLVPIYLRRPQAEREAGEL